MGTKYVCDGTSWRPIDEEVLNLHDKIPAGHYLMCHDQRMGFHIEKVPPFELPKKLYGDCVVNSKRILTTFRDRKSTTGVLLTGTKGSGKTLLAKHVGNTAVEGGMIVILVNSPYGGDGFADFMQDIYQPCIVIFDEFEKVYKEETQEGILTLLDGVFQGDKLFMFTCNDRYRINSHMINRPGRIYYKLDFKGLDNTFIQQYCKDNLKKMEHAPAICAVAGTFAEFNFDMLQSMVEEMNRYDEDPFQVVKILNVEPDHTNHQAFDTELYLDGKRIEGAQPSDGVGVMYYGQPLFDEDLEMRYKEDLEDEDSDYDQVTFTLDNIIKYDPVSGYVEYKKDDYILKLKRHRGRTRNYSEIMKQYAYGYNL